MDAPARHLRLLTETIAAVNSTLDLRFKSFSNLPEDEYESILAVPILAREKLAGALNVRTRRPREFTDAEVELLVAIAAQVAQTIEHAQLYADAQRRVGELEALARISGAFAVRIPLRWKGRQIGELVCDRDIDFTPDERALLASIAHHAAVALEHGRAVMRGVLAQEIHHRVKNNLQTVASLLRLQARATDADPRKALEDSVHRILAIAAVHEVLTEQREEVVELRELLERLRAMLVQGLAVGKEVHADLESVSIAGNRATALALVFSELLQNALEHGGDSVQIDLAQRNGEVVLSIADDGSGIEADVMGTGLSIVHALVRDELQGRLALTSEGGTRAEVVFPV